MFQKKRNVLWNIPEISAYPVDPTERDSINQNCIMVILVVMDIIRAWAKKTSKKEPKSEVIQSQKMKLKLFIDPHRTLELAEKFSEGKTILFARSTSKYGNEVQIEIDLDEIDIKSLHGNKDGNITFKKKVN